MLSHAILGGKVLASWQGTDVLCFIPFLFMNSANSAPTEYKVISETILSGDPNHKNLAKTE